MDRMEPLSVGWLGLGGIGMPMAQRLLRAGWPVRVCAHANRAPVEAMVAAGATEVADPYEVAEEVDVLVSIVRDQAQTDAALLSDRGALAGLAPGSTLVIMSTLAPSYCRDVAARAADIWVAVLDAPVSGGAPAASRGELSIMVGGSDDAVALVRPLLHQLGSSIFHLGPVGMGQVAKIVNNAVKICVVAATTEGLDIGVRSGLRADALLEVLKAGTANSHVVEHWGYYYDYKRAHRPGGPLDILKKDIGLALDLACEVGIDVPVAEASALVDVGRLVGEP